MYTICHFVLVKEYIIWGIEDIYTIWFVIIAIPIAPMFGKYRSFSFHAKILLFEELFYPNDRSRFQMPYVPFLFMFMYNCRYVTWGHLIFTYLPVIILLSNNSFRIFMLLYHLYLFQKLDQKTCFREKGTLAAITLCFKIL